MSKQKEAMSKSELKQLAETLVIFQQLPEKERIAIQYYIKGRIDVAGEKIQIPVGAVNAMPRAGAF